VGPAPQGQAKIQVCVFRVVRVVSCVLRLACRSRPKRVQLHGPGVMAQLDKRRLPSTLSAGSGPLATRQKLDLSLTSAGARSRWLLEARLDAILGGSSRSHKSVRSGIRCWMGFVGKLPVCALLSVGIASGAFLLSDRYDPVWKRHFHPPLELLLPWTTLFRSGGTLRNYFGYVQTGCLMVDVPTHVFQEPALKKAKASVDAACNFRRRESMFVQRQAHVLGLVPRYVCVWQASG